MAYASPVSFRTPRGRSLPALPLVLSLLVAVLTSCSHSANKPGKEKSTATAVGPLSGTNAEKAPPPSFLRYPRTGSAIEPWVQEQVELAEASKLRVLVYVGASWCEPCQRFHQAVEHGELDGALNGLRFLEFDQDQDAAALKTAGYVYQYIPVLALPDPDGRNHGKMISGSLKGSRAIKDNLVPRLQALLNGQAVD
ncbi:MAG TPA: thioredoxin family protein [Polyangiaceae bacterium]|jgi:thiol-disulfide isomerase/thioredoxin|nr:thioredoxin family protein [Polyangiaceae bacterium]